MSKKSADCTPHRLLRMARCKCKHCHQRAGVTEPEMKSRLVLAKKGMDYPSLRYESNLSSTWGI